jgi:hypothetical protein
VTHPPGYARVVYILLPDGRIQMRSESSADGETYTAYFETWMSPVKGI